MDKADNRPVMEDWHARPADQAHVAAIVKNSGTSFYWGMRLLAQPRRMAMYGVYAFCREVDDIADSFSPSRERLQALAQWKERIERLYAGRPDHAITRILREPVETYGLPREDFMAMIAGMEMDAREIMRWPGLEELTLYCRRVAGTVGLLSTRIFGETSDAGHRHAIALGHAFQLTNILSDIHKDAQRDRLYLPREDLYACGVEDASPAEVLSDPALVDVCGQVAERARAHFAEADACYRQCNAGKLRPARIMRSIYLDILDALEKRGWRKLAQPVRMSGWRKAWLGLTGGWR